MIAIAPSLVVPAFHTVPDHVSTAGAEAADLASLSGFVPDAEQRLILDAIYAEQQPGSNFQSGRWAALEVAVVSSRQNVKTSSLLMAALADLFLYDARLVIWTAHLFSTAAEAFLEFKQLIDANAHLSRKVRRITEAAGNQGVELMSGARIKFLARSKASGRGLSGDAVIFDEAYALTAAEIGALVPTLSARPNPSVRYGSSAGRLESEVLRGIRDRGRIGDESLAYLEWCSTASCVAPQCHHEVGSSGCVLDDPVEWQKANPAMGRRIDPAYIASERRALTPQEFARERLGWWDDPTGYARVIPELAWVALTRDDTIAGPVSVSVEVTMKRDEACVWVCGANSTGTAQIECADHRAGTDWVSERVGELIERHEVLAVGCRSGGPVASLLPELRGVCEDSQTEFVAVNSAQFAGMCGGFFDAVIGGSLAHRADPRLNASVSAAKRHQQVDAWTWERSQVDVDAAPLVAATGAYALFVQHSRRAEYDPLDNLW